MKSDNPIQAKSYAFALRIVKLYRYLCDERKEFAFHNGHYGTREDVVFLINGIPVLVIECKNANKDEAIALGVDQIRRYHTETPELFVSQQLFTATDAIGFSYGVSWNTVRRCIFRGSASRTGSHWNRRFRRWAQIKKTQ